jgi:hypothetical protein
LGGFTYQHSPAAVFLATAALAFVGAEVARRAIGWRAPAEKTAWIAVQRRPRSRPRV